MLYSFDIFDTLISRVTNTPVGIFDIMQHKLKSAEGYSEYLRDDFANLRVEAERKAREFAHYKNLEEVSLADIYEALNDLVKLSEEDTRNLINLELLVERQSLYPIEKRVDTVRKLIKNNEQVILISDMYVSGHILTDMLVSLDDVFANIPIYVSCDYGYTKNTGTLYAFIHDELQVTYGEWCHTGDNYNSDYLVPHTLGIHCTYVEKKPEYPWLIQLKNNNKINPLNYELVCGAVGRAKTDNQSCLRQLGFGFGGIIIEAYAKWLVSNAYDIGIEELYFIARDGYVVKKVVDKLIEEYRYHINTHYIYGSRCAWRVDEDSEAGKNLICYFREIVDFRKQIAFVDSNGFGISIARVADLLGEVWERQVPIFYFSFHRKVESEKCQFYSFSNVQGDVIEVLCSAPHGTTLGYEKMDGHIIPVLEQTAGSLLDISEYINGVLTYTQFMLEVEEQLQMDLEPREIAVALATTNAYMGCMSHHDLWEALWGKSVPMEGVLEKYRDNPLSAKNQKGKRFIIYGAGRVGRRLYNAWQQRAQVDIVAWTDINHEKCMEEGLPVVSIHEALQQNYDYIVLAIKNNMAKKSAKCILGQLGIDESVMIDIGDIIE